MDKSEEKTKAKVAGDIDRTGSKAHDTSNPNPRDKAIITIISDAGIRIVEFIPYFKSIDNIQTENLFHKFTGVKFFKIFS